MYRLVCRQDPVALGIANADGSWHLDRLAAHIKRCRPCARFTLRVTRCFQRALSQNLASAEGVEDADA